MLIYRLGDKAGAMRRRPICASARMSAGSAVAVGAPARAQDLNDYPTVARADTSSPA
jgi:hypothetical protein